MSLAIVLVLVLPAGAPGQEVNGPTLQSPFAPCEVEPRSREDFDRILATLESQPVSLAGTFPQIDDASQIDYSVTDTSDIEIDGVTFAINGLLIPAQGTLPPTFNEVAGIVDLLYQWTACVQKLDALRLAGLMSENAIRWACAPRDPFNHQRSPASWLCGNHGLSQTLGTLPLVVVDAARQADGRVVVTLTDLANLLVNPVSPPASLWILAEMNGVWRIDGVIGGLLLNRGLARSDVIVID